MALPPEPASDTPSASDPDFLHVDESYPELTEQVDRLYWEFERWTSTRADDVELFSILASGSGSDGQRRVREAQRRGETLPLTEERPLRNRPR
jgi:hypothetical protein